MLIFFGLIALAVLFVASAFWSGAETALASLSRYRIKKLIALDKSLTGPLGQWLKSPYYLLTTILIGNTVNDMILSFLATVMMVKAFSLSFTFIDREIVEAVSWVCVTFVLLVLGEVTPKVFGRANPEKVTIFCLPILSRIERMTRPLIRPLGRLVRMVFPRVDILPPVGRLTYLSLEEITGLIAEANQTGMLPKDTSQMLERVLKLGEVEVTKIMTPLNALEAVNLSQPEDRFLDIAVETGRSRVPVYSDDPRNIAGYVYTKDLLWAWKSNNGHFSHDLVRPAYFVRQDKKIYDLLKDFQSGQTHIAFVRDGLNNLVGIVTLEDILEEIVGEILDEYDLKEDQ